MDFAKASKYLMLWLNCGSKLMAANKDKILKAQKFS